MKTVRGIPLWTTIIASSCWLLLLSGGCAAPASSLKMVPKDYEVSKKHSYTVKIETTGGRETNPLWTSQISSSDFGEAVSKAIMESGVFQRVTKDNAADYLLEISILNCSQPVMGLDMTVGLETKWKVSRIGPSGEYKLLWSDTIASSYTAKVGEAFVAVERLKKANEGAARENIREGIKRVSMLAL